MILLKTMNPADLPLPSKDLGEEQEEASCSGLFKQSSYNNANISNESKGAIPKIKALKRTSKQKVKLNNETPQIDNSEKSSQIVDTSLCETEFSNKVCDTGPPKDSADSSSDDELLSISDDGCIYTYKPDDVADLPSSFYNLDVSKSPKASPPRRDGSPEMDYLEMDFDPGPSGSGDADSDTSDENLPQNLTPRLPSPPQQPHPVPSCSNIPDVKNIEKCGSVPPTKCDNKVTPPVENSEVLDSTSIASVPSSTSNISHSEQMPWSCLLKERTRGTNKNYVRLTNCHLSDKGELLYSSANEEYDCDRLEQVMIWSEEEACKKQLTQIAASACGATAVINVLNALGFLVPPIDTVQSVVQTRPRINSSSLLHFLVSRSFAGSTHEDIIKGLNILSDNKIYSRFFHMYPERVLNLNWWLQYWISQGAVPVATLNLQKCCGVIPDTWHHQMIFGVGPCGVYLTNPLECVKSELLWPQLSSESILLIRRDDVLNRWNTDPALDDLMRIRDRRWTTINVVGQVANLVREAKREFRPGFTTTTHIKIPATYSAGITLSILKDSPACKFLQNCPELPFLPSSDDVCDTDIF